MTRREPRQPRSGTSARRQKPSPRARPPPSGDREDWLRSRQETRTLPAGRGRRDDVRDARIEGSREDVCLHRQPQVSGARHARHSDGLRSARRAHRHRSVHLLSEGPLRRLRVCARPAVARASRRPARLAPDSVAVCVRERSPARPTASARNSGGVEAALRSAHSRRGSIVDTRDPESVRRIRSEPHTTRPSNTC